MAVSLTCLPPQLSLSPARRPATSDAPKSSLLPAEISVSRVLDIGRIRTEIVGLRCCRNFQTSQRAPPVGGLSISLGRSHTLSLSRSFSASVYEPFFVAVISLFFGSVGTEEVGLRRCRNIVVSLSLPLRFVWDADVVINGLPSTETREVFDEISRYWRVRINPPVIISLAKVGIPMENILYLGGPNIASEIYNKEYANARICGAENWRKPLA